MPTLQAFRGANAILTGYGNEALHWFKPPMTVHTHPETGQFWNRENWMAFGYGTLRATQTEGFKMLGQVPIFTNRGERVVYQVPDGYTAYVTVVVSCIAFPGTIRVAIVDHDAMNPTGVEDYVFYDEPVNVDNPLKYVTTLGPGHAVRAYSTAPIAFNLSVSVFGYESLEV